MHLASQEGKESSKKTAKERCYFSHRIAVHFFCFEKNNLPRWSSLCLSVKCYKFFCQNCLLCSIFSTYSYSFLPQVRILYRMCVCMLDKEKKGNLRCIIIISQEMVILTRKEIWSLDGKRDRKKRTEKCVCYVQCWVWWEWRNS